MLPVLIVATLAVLAWAAWLHRGDARRWIIWIGRGQLLAAAACAAVSLWQLRKAELALDHGDPANRATELAMGVSRAMNAMAAGFVPVALAIIALTYATATRKRAGRADQITKL